MAKPSEPSRSVDVVVVTYNPGDTLQRFLDSVDSAGEVASVTVVDSASPEQTARDVAAKWGLTFLPMPSNRGYGAAANAGAALGSAPWIAICNADIMLSRGALGTLVRAGEEGEDVGAVGPLIRDLDGTLYPSARPLPSLGMGMGHSIFGRMWPSNPWTRKYRKGMDPTAGPEDVGWLSGSCLVVRRRAFEEVGGFDEGYFMFMEDVDLGRRLGRAGYRCRWIPEATVGHVGGHTWRSDPEPMIRAHHASVGRYVSIVYPGLWRAPLRALLRLGLRIRQKVEVAAARRARAD
ncbi:MAG: glycosyltransferase family 2 protein [Demequinaceae bacterium]|nr:glycosyltransferase family 2 protein [Demequinaceae bacterium]